MPDGAVLRADVYRPTGQAAELPVLVLRTPYDKATAQTSVFQHPVWYARHGYVVVVQDVRGRFASEGEFYPFRHEGADGAETIRWAAELEGSNGLVGTYGFSYASVAQLLAAGERPEPLRCCVPALGGGDVRDCWIYENGALRLAFVLSWVVQLLAVADALHAGKPGEARELYRLAGRLEALSREGPLRDLEPLRRAGVADYFFDWLEHDGRDDYWRSLSVEAAYDSISVPCIHVGGWFDTFLAGTLADYTALLTRGRAEQHLVVGPWLHVPWSPLVGRRWFGDAARNGIDELQLAWFDRWLKEAPAQQLPPVRLFAMGENRWRDEAAWPPTDTAVEQWHLRSAGRALSLSGDGRLTREPPSDEPPDVFVSIPGDPVPSLGGSSCCALDATPMGSFDQTAVEIRNDVLVYTSEPLERPLEVTGVVELVLNAASDAPSADWAAKLVDVDTEGRAWNVCDGIVRVPGGAAGHRIVLGGTSIVFGAGHRIRLEVASSNFPQYDVNPQTGVGAADADPLDSRAATQAVFHDAARPSRLLLPVRR
jgi:uncharacterized protein